MVNVVTVVVFLLISIILATVILYNYLSNRSKSATIGLIVASLEPLYLHGWPAIIWLMEDTFYRLGQYLEHGLCYEAAAYTMLALKDYPRSRLVWGIAKCDSGNYCRHAWVEIKHYGFWWVIDGCWATPMAIIWRPLYYYNFTRVKHVARIFSYQEFWKYHWSKLLGTKISQPRTSHILYELSAYRNDDDRKTEFRDDYVTFNNSEQQKIAGEWYNPNGILRQSQIHPISERIIRDFLVRRKRTQPKRRNIRRAYAINKRIEQYLKNKATAAEYIA